MNAQRVVFAANLASAEFISHPLQKHLTFIFTDFQPNGNKQAVPRSEAENILRTALNMPIKINFSDGPNGHKYSEPVGTIVRVWEENDKIYAQAVLWADEFPDIAEYIQKAFANNEGVQFSWELYFKEGEIDEAGVQWLKGVVAAAATIVDNPAYQGRTPLTALAEGTKMKELEEMRSKLEAISAEVTDLKTKLASTEAEKSALETEKADMEVKYKELVEFKNSIEAEASVLEKTNSLKDKLTTAGIKMSDADFDERKSVLLAMPEEILALYIKDMSAAATKPATAEKSKDIDTTVIPDGLIEKKTTTFSKKDLAEALRSYRRRG